MEGGNLNWGCKMYRPSPHKQILSLFVCTCFRLISPLSTSPHLSYTIFPPKKEDWKPLALSIWAGLSQIKTGTSPNKTYLWSGGHQLSIKNCQFSWPKLSCYKMLLPLPFPPFCTTPLDWCWLVTMLSSTTGKTFTDKKCPLPAWFPFFTM